MGCQSSYRYRTASGLEVERHSEQVAPQALASLARALDERRGALLESTYEYPGRYRRRAIAFVDPPLVLESRAHRFTLRALNPRGELLLEALAPAITRAPELTAITRAACCIEGSVRTLDEPFAEEARTRRPSLLSLVRLLRDQLAHDREPLLGLYGAFGYDLVLQLETLTQRQARTGSRELVLYLPDELLVREGEDGATVRHRYEFRTASGETHDLARSGDRAPFVASPVLQASCDHGEGEFERAVERAKAAFARGDLFEVTLSQTFRRPFAGDPSSLFAQLQQTNPAPYGFLVNLGEGELLVGASPEMYVRVRGTTVETCPIAGTIARGGDAFEDERQIRTLLASDKDEAELTMCTDVDRNDKARICEPGSVRVVGRRQIELYSRLIHSVDHVQGRLRAGYDALDALLTHMWAVTVTGAPKLDAMQFIEDHERSPRGYYGGAVGSVLFDGTLDTGLTLRTVHLREGGAEIRAGATLLFDSDPAEERRESELKASALLAVLAPRAEAVAREPVPARPKRKLRVLLVDHRDSFVHTLADYFRQADCEVTTLRHGFGNSVYERLAPELVVLSPGPKRPRDFGMHALLAELARRRLPVFGVCLGLQGMVEYAGGALVQLAVPMHGKASSLAIARGSSELFAGLPTPLSVGRYHSLAARASELPAELALLAESADEGYAMAIAHRTLPWHAVQFHPESILSARGGHGLSLIANVVALARAANATRERRTAAEIAHAELGG